MNPFLTIWSRPKETVRYILEEKTVGYAIMLTLLGSLANSLMAFADSGVFGDLPLAAILAIIIGVVLLVGIIGWVIISGLYTVVGKMLGGHGTMTSVGKVIGATALPGIWMAPLNLIILIIYGKGLFAEPEGIQLTILPIGLYLIYNLLMFGIGIYAVVIQSIGLGLAHGFSSLRGFGAIAIVAGGMFVIALIFTFSIFTLFLF